MQVSALKETRRGERRVAVTPDIVGKYTGAGLKVVIETGAGEGAGFPDRAYTDAGAICSGDIRDILAGTDILLRVGRPSREAGGRDEAGLLKRGALVLGFLSPYTDREEHGEWAGLGLTTCAVELLPRISRAQSMDALSSQSSLVGYRAVIEAASLYRKAFAMMTTAAGPVAPARVFVMGAGVAGLQAIATAGRLGAIVTATDVRPETREQVESLGAGFIGIEDEETRQAQTAGGYAREMSPDWQRRQQELVAGHIAGQDIVITTALIPGRKAPVLVTPGTVENMRHGSVIVDLAAESGGNCPLSRSGQVNEVNGVLVFAPENPASGIPADASRLYARNLFNILSLLVPAGAGEPVLDMEDDIIRSIVLTRDGRIVHPDFRQSPRDPASGNGPTEE